MHPSTKQRFNDRVLTLIFYLNDGWEVADGGELRIHPNLPHASDESFLRSVMGEEGRASERAGIEGKPGWAHLHATFCQAIPLEKGLHPMLGTFPTRSLRI